MSETGSESESDLDFSASEDEYVPPEDADSESDDYPEQSFVGQPSSSKKLTKSKSKPATRKSTVDDDDSDSSVDDYLVNPNELDLSSDFFNPNKKVVPDAPTFDCNVGLKLSDSEEEVFEAAPSASQAAGVKFMEFKDFDAELSRKKELQDALETLAKLKAFASNFGRSDSVKNLLEIGEPSLAAKESSESKRKEVMDSSDESDFEDVEEKTKTEKKSDVEVHIGAVSKKKTDKYQAEIEASIKRKINRRKKENQLMMHKVHLLGWIAYGNYINKILNSTKLMEMVVKYIPSEKCYPKDKTDQQYFEQISKWYKTTVGLKSNEQNCPLKCLPPIATSLALQIQSKMAICKKDFVFIFVVLLRSMGIQCRLVINLATVPIRPAVKDLCVISTKPTEKSSSSDKVKQDKKSKNTAKGSSQAKNAAKDSTASKPKSKSRTNSIAGTKSEILMTKAVDSNQKKETKSGDDKKKNLKRSVSVQSSSSVNDNNKRSRIQSSSTLKANDAPKVMSSMPNGTSKTVKLRSSSVQKPTSTTGTSSKLSLSTQLSTETNAVESPVSNRTRKKKLSLGAPPSIPQLDGGDDKKKKKPQAGLYKIRLPVRVRSVSSSPDATSKAKPSEEGAQSSDSKSPASEHVSRKSRFEKSKSNDNVEASLLEPKSPKSNEVSPKASSAATSKTGKKPLYTSPTKPWRQLGSSKDLSSSSLHETEHKTNAESQQVQPETTESTAKALSPLKQASNLDDTISKDATSTSGSSTKSTESSKRSNSKTANAAKKQRSRSKEPTSTTTNETLSPTKSTKPTASSKSSNSITKSSNSDKKHRSKSIEPTSTSTTATASTTKSGTSSEQSNSKTKSSKPDKKLRSRSKEPAATSSATTSPTKAATSSNRSNSKTKSSDAAKKQRSKSVEESKRSNSKTKSSDPAVSSLAESSELSSTNKQSKSKSNAKSSTVEKSVKAPLKRKATISISSDSDFAPTPKKKSSTANGGKPLPKPVERLKKGIDRRILSSDDESLEPAVKKDDMNYWIEVYCEAESKWICIDLFKVKVNCVEEVKKKATKPIAYVFAWNNNNKIKDVSPRYCSQWNTTTRKLRVEPDWLAEALSRYREPLSQRCVAEDRELEEIHAQTPIPTSISELKNHPLYVLPRHLLKFEGIYPPNPVPVGFIRDEPIYSRLCVHTLHSREIWVKQARVVKPGEIPYKIVKARPKWDRLANKMLECQPLEIFGRWQTGPYVPPTAENGIVPRNAYGNVELFKPEMLPKKTVHLRLAGLNRVCAKLKIDCAQAVVGFDFHGGSSHPTFDGFVVCEEFAELVTERWCEEQEESYRKAKEKQSQRVYDNWKKLIKGLLIRERLQRKYNFAGKNPPKET